MASATQFPQALSPDDITVQDRVRSEMGDIDGLANSIKEFGGTLVHPIQPIVLAFGYTGLVTLVAGGRRLTALKRLGVKELVHGKHYVWRDEIEDGSEEIKLKLQGIELEENLRRKEMTWQEVVLAKQRLMATMQRIHGVAQVGGRTRDEKQSGVSSGFGVRTMASMLGESPALSSQDLQLASVMSIPAIKNAPNKTAAMQTLANLIAATKPGGQNAKVAPLLSYRLVIHCKDENDQGALAIELETRGYKCDMVIV